MRGAPVVATVVERENKKRTMEREKISIHFWVCLLDFLGLLGLLGLLKTEVKKNNQQQQKQTTKLSRFHRTHHSIGNVLINDVI